MGVLGDQEVCRRLRHAWQESQPGTSGAHEEGGFVLQDVDGSLTVERWPKGGGDEIVVPDHPGGKRAGKIIVATFHTHPNPPPGYQQEPSLTDIRAVRYDPDLHHPEYEGEYVIALATVYRILPDGTVEEVGDTSGLLSIP